MIIGLTGLNGAGKGEVATYLQERGFYYHSLSDAIREEIRRRKKRVTRRNLILVGNELRTRYGPGVLGDRTLTALAPDRNYVIDSIRHPAEVAVLRARKDFTLWAVQAPVKTRFDRVRRRARENDPRTLPAFRAMEAQELAHPDAAGQQLRATVRLADTVIRNHAALDTLHRHVGTAMERLARDVRTRVKRPSWDEYFMNIARTVATRSNCIKRKVAAIVVRDRRIISTGYNGTPRGITNCDEGGCARCNSFAASGTRLDECLCSHAEENAITQAAYHGISLKDATLYSTFAPCLWCTKMIVNAGILEVVYNVAYPLNDTALSMLREAHITLRQLQE